MDRFIFLILLPIRKTKSLLRSFYQATTPKGMLWSGTQTENGTLSVGATMANSLSGIVTKNRQTML